MVKTTSLAVLAAVPSCISAQSTSTTTVIVSTTSKLACVTAQDYTPLASGVAVPTWTNTITERNTIRPSTYHTQNTVTISVDATTITNVIDVTSTVTTTTTIVPATVTSQPAAGWLPLRAQQQVPLATATAVPRIKRAQLLAGRSPLRNLFKRDNVNWGYEIEPISGIPEPLHEKFDQEVWCDTKLIINETVVYIVTDPETTIRQQATASAVSTRIISTTTTATTVAPTPTFWPACQANNIVNSIDYDLNGKRMFFDSIFFRRPSSNNSDVNEVTVPLASAFDCCVECQKIPQGCSEAFFTPGDSKCRMRLRLPITPNAPAIAAGNATLPTSTSPAVVAILPTALAPHPVCPDGSLTEYVGEIRGKENFPERLALSAINGPCGRLSVNTVPRDGIGGSGASNLGARAASGVVGLLSG